MSFLPLAARGGRYVALLSFGVVTSLAACSSSDDGAPPAVATPDGGDVDADASTLTPSVACTTLHRQLQRPNPAYYRVFASDQEALVYAQPLLARLGRKAALPPGDALQAQGAALAKRAYEGLARLYPDDVAGMPGPPRVLVVDDDTVNAFATIDSSDATDRSPWIFFFHRGALQKYAADPDSLMGTAAHELGHLVVKNNRPEVQAAVATYYKVPGTSEDGVFGEYQTTDPTEKATVDKITLIGEYCGQVTEVELNGYPYSLGQGEGGPTDKTAAFADWLRTLESAAPAGNASCAKALAGESTIHALLDSKANVDADIILGADAPKLDAMTKAFATDIGACLSTVTVPLLNVAAAFYLSRHPKDKAAVDNLLATDPDKLATLIRAVPARNVDKQVPTGSTVAKLLLVSKQFQAGLRAIVEDPKTDYPNLRYYFIEDESDVVSTRVLELLGIPFQKRADYFIDLLPKAAGAECRAKIAADTRVGYGGFVDTHHGNCWRAYRGLQLEKALGTCGAGWPEDAAAKPKAFGDGGT